MDTNKNKNTGLTKKDIQLVKSLKSIHGRKKNNAFLIEGIKNVEELLLSSIKIKKLYLTETLPKNKFQFFTKMCAEKSLDYMVLPDYEYQKISTMKNPEGALAVCDYQDDANLEKIRLPAVFLTYQRIKSLENAKMLVSMYTAQEGFERVDIGVSGIRFNIPARELESPEVDHDAPTLIPGSTRD